MTIFYKNGKMDEIFVSKDVVCRFLKTKGNSGDKGYIAGENLLLCDYLVDLLSSYI